MSLAGPMLGTMITASGWLESSRFEEWASGLHICIYVYICLSSCLFLHVYE